MPMLRRFWDARTGTCSYLLASPPSRQAVFIDPVREHVPLYLGVLSELGLSLAGVLDTHLHADHISAAATLREITGAAIGCSLGSGVEEADYKLRDGDTLTFGEVSLSVVATPGHSPDCLTYRWGDRLFTGDSLLIGGCGRTDEPGSNPGLLFDSLSRRLLVLPDEDLVFPGHASQVRWVSCIGEEKRNNPMLAGVSRDEFIALCRRREVPPVPGMAAGIVANLAANRRAGREACAA